MNLLLSKKSLFLTEIHIDRWQCALYASNNYELWFWEPSEKELKEIKSKNIGLICHTVVKIATPGTNIPLRSWNWRGLISYIYTQSSLPFHFKDFYSELHYFNSLDAKLENPIFGELLSLNYESRCSKLFLAEVFKDMKNKGIKIMPCKITMDPAINIYLWDDDLFYHSLGTVKYENNLEFLKAVFENHEFFSSLGDYFIDRLIEYGFAGNDMFETNNELMCRNLVIAYNRKCKNFATIKYRIKLSILFFPREVSGIIYGYIPWWNNIDSEVGKLLMTEVEKYYNCKVYSDAAMARLTRELGEAREEIRRLKEGRMIIAPPSY